MDDVSMADLVCLHLDGVEDDDASPAPPAVSTPGIAAAMDLGTDTIADRIELLSSLSKLSAAGIVEERTDRVQDKSGERRVYSLTPAGRGHAEELREQLLDEHIVVRTTNGDRRVELASIDEHVEGLGDDDPLVTALARSSNGTLVLEDIEDEDVLSDDHRFVDRKQELATIRDRLSNAIDGNPQTVFVCGEPGVGKTTLVRELEADVENHNGVFCYGRCHSDVSEPFQAFATAFADLPDGFGDELNAALTETPPFEAEERETVEAQRQARFFDIANGLADVASGVPLIVFIDDMQWADRATSLLFTALSRRIDTGSIMLLGACRPETASGDWPLSRALEELEEDEYDWIDVDRLDREWTGRLVRRLVGRLDVPDSFVDVVYERTDGNPLFVTETITQLLETGLIDPTLGIYPSDEDLDIPDSVGQSIVSRFETLDEDAWELLQLASVAGDSIPRPVLEEAADLGEATFRDYAGMFIGSGVWRHESAQETLYFQSGVVRESVRAEVGDERRRQFHERIADAYRSTEPENGAHATAIAHHRRRAGDLETALERYRQAADRARSLYAHEVAIETLEGAVDVARELGDDESVVIALEHLGDVNRILDRFDDGERCYHYVRERSNDPVIVQRTYRKEANLHADHGRFDAAVTCADRGLDLENRISEAPTDETVKLLQVRGYALMQQGLTDEALDVSKRATNIASDLGDADVVATALRGLGNAHLSKGEIEAAKSAFAESVELMRESDDDHALAASLLSYGNTLNRSEQYEMAVETYEEARELAAAIGDRDLEISVLNNVGIVYQYLDEDQQAIERFEEATELAETIENPWSLSMPTLNLGYAQLNQGAFEEAIECAHRARRLAEEMGDVSGTICTHEILAAERLYRGDLDGAEHHANEALTLARDIDDRNRAASDLALVGEIHIERENLDSAKEAFEEGLEISLEVGNTQKATLNRSGLVRTLVERGDLDGASEYVPKLETDETMTSETIPALAAFYREQDEFDRASSLLDTALDTVQTAGKRPLECTLEFEYAELEAARGDVDRAHDHLDRAESIATDLDLETVGRRCERLRSEIG